MSDSPTKSGWGRFWRWILVPANLFLLALLVVATLRVVLPDRDAELVKSVAEQEVVVRGRLYEDPDQGEDKTYRVRINNLMLCLDEENCVGAKANIFATLRVSAVGSEGLERGDTIVIRGKLKSGFGAFSGTIYRAEVLAHSKSDPPDRFLIIRNWFSAGVEEHIPAPGSSLALGYLLGQKRALPMALLNVLAITGLTHIVVASGANLTIITRMLRRLFGKSRLRAFVMGVLAIGFMVGIIGLAPSLVRASLVSILALTAWYVGRPVHPVRLILLAATTTLIINPTFILDLGWQLSFAAFGGVLLLAPVLTRFFYGEARPRALPQIAIETISATIATLPILLYNFGYVSLLSLIPNLLILPTIPLAMLLAFLTGVFAQLGLVAVGGGLAAGFGGLATIILRYHIAVINFFGELDFAILKMEFSLAQTAVAYAVILALWLALKFGTKTRLIETNVVE